MSEEVGGRVAFDVGAVEGEDLVDLGESGEDIGVGGEDEGIDGDRRV
jgi:hypothetical protein